jgi:hypothetical protein
MSEKKNEDVNAFNTMDLLTAILFGLAAIATAFASFQSALYGGRSVEAYSRANKIATEAAAERSRTVLEMAKDTSVDVEAMILTLEADNAPNTAVEERNYYIATYLYAPQMSEPGYKALGLPPKARKVFDRARGGDAVEQKQEALQETVLEKAMEKDLAEDVNYRQEMFAKSQSQFDKSEESFKEGQTANQTGDKFQLAAVIYAMSLFFGGIEQVFRSARMRQVILGAGGLIFVHATIYMLRIPLIFS